MTEAEVVILMESSRTEQEWNANCGKVKAAFNGYPPFWFKAINQSGVAKRTLEKFGASDEIQISLN